MNKKKGKTYIFYEIGDSCRTEFLFKDFKFHPTEDAVIIGTAEGKNVKDAFKKLKLECEWIKNYRLERLVAREVKQEIYL